MSAEVTAILASSDARDARRLDARTSRRNGKTSAEVTAILPSQDASNARVLTTRLDRRTNGVNNMDPANPSVLGSIIRPDQQAFETKLANTRMPPTSYRF